MTSAAACCRTGSLARLIREDGIAGLTSNPAIFANSIMTDPQYGQPIAQLLPRVSSSIALYEELATRICATRQQRSCARSTMTPPAATAS